jgi:hypothetical protein
MTAFTTSLSFPARTARNASGSREGNPGDWAPEPSPLGSLPSQRFALLAGNDNGVWQ